MKLTSFTDYTLRVLMYLGLETERLATIQGIAEAYGISENHLMKLVHHLAKSGIVESLRCKGGRRRWPDCGMLFQQGCLQDHA